MLRVRRRSPARRRDGAIEAVGPWARVLGTGALCRWKTPLSLPDAEQTAARIRSGMSAGASASRSRASVGHLGWLGVGASTGPFQTFEKAHVLRLRLSTSSGHILTTPLYSHCHYTFPRIGGRPPVTLQVLNAVILTLALGCVATLLATVFL